MAEYIDKKELYQKLFLTTDGNRIQFYDVDNFPTIVKLEQLHKIILKFPTVDAIAVIRCKNCKYLMFSDCYGECSKGYMGIVSPNDYCSHGERKGDE